MMRKFIRFIFIVAAVLFAAFAGLVIFLMIDTDGPKEAVQEVTSETVMGEEASDKFVEEITLIREADFPNTVYMDTPLILEKSQCEQLLSDVQEKQDFFSYAEYYHLNDAWTLYDNRIVGQKKASVILDEQGKLDAKLLMEQVTKNNEAYMSDGANTINIFYSEIETEDMMCICQTIADVVNAECYQIPIENAAAKLMEMTMFQRTGSASNAYVTNDMTFVYNPTMTANYCDMQQIRGSEESWEQIWQSVIVHECMHLLQHSLGDNDSSNGLEAGFCRMYNDPNEEKTLIVDALWYSWLLEASAELGMTEFMDVAPGTYQKKISYVNSYNFSRFYGLSHGIEELGFVGTLEDAFEKMSLESEEERRHFLEMLYSIEIIQMDPEEFWQSYNTDLSDEDMLEIRMNIRTEVINYLTQNYYRDLIQAIQAKKINDYATLFYMIRLWEFDVFSHLQYDVVDNRASAKDAVDYQHTLQMQIFDAIGDGESIMKAYQEYSIYLKDGENRIVHSNLSAFDESIQMKITEMMDNLAVKSYVRNETMYEYFLKND